MIKKLNKKQNIVINYHEKQDMFIVRSKVNESNDEIYNVLYSMPDGVHIKPWMDCYELDDIIDGQEYIKYGRWKTDVYGSVLPIEYASGRGKYHIILDQWKDSEDQLISLMLFYDHVYKEAILYSISFDLNYIDKRYLHIEIFKKYKGMNCISNIFEYIVKNDILTLYYQNGCQNFCNIDKDYHNYNIYSYRCRENDLIITHNNLYHIKYMLLTMIKDSIKDYEKYKVFDDSLFHNISLYNILSVKNHIKIYNNLFILTYDHLYKISKYDNDCQIMKDDYIENDDDSYIDIKYQSDELSNFIIKIFDYLNVDYIFKDKYLALWTYKRNKVLINIYKIDENIEICKKGLHCVFEVPIKIFEFNKDIIINTFIEEIEEEIEKEKKINE